MIPFIQRHVIYPMIEKLRAEPISRCCRELDATQWYSREQLREIQWNKLKRLLVHCRDNVPFYRRRFEELQIDPRDISDLEAFGKLPPLTKDDVRFNQLELQDENHRRRVEPAHSGGTLGIPLNLIRDSSASAYARAAAIRGLGWFGVRKEDRQVRICGAPLDPGEARKAKIKDMLLNRVRLSPFRITPETVSSYYHTMKRFGPRYVYAYPSALDQICRGIEELGLDGRGLGIELAVTTSETLFSHQRSRIEKTLQCRVANEYGCSEMGAIAKECPEGSLHLSMENLLVEFVENELGFGPPEILLTNLNSYSMPFLRYRIGDTGQLLDKTCPCGRKLDVMSFDAGRVLSMLVAADGSYVSGTLFCYIAFDVIEKFGGIKDFRVVQRARDKLEIALVKDADLREETLQLFTGKVREKFGSQMKIEYEFLDEIPPERSGKRLFVWSELSGDESRLDPNVG